MAFTINWLPEHLKKIEQTELMTEKTAPASFLKSHTTPNNYHALLVIKKGELIISWDNSGSQTTFDCSKKVNIQPKCPYHLILKTDVQFHLEYYSDKHVTKTVAKKSINGAEIVYLAKNLRKRISMIDFIALVDQTYGPQAKYHNRALKNVNATEIIDYYIKSGKI